VVLVSAALVFALAVGVILGSGPLRTALLGQGANEADALRADLAARDADVASATHANDVLARYIAELEPFTTEGRLGDVNLALVIAPGVTPEQAERVASAVTASGASVVATTTLSELWLDPDQVAFRTALAEEIVADVGVATEQTAPEAVLHAALAQVLVPSLAVAPEPWSSDEALPPDTTLPQEQAAVLLDVLTRAGLVTVSRAQVAAGEAIAEPTVVVLLTPETGTQTVAEDQGYADASAALLRLAITFAQSDLSTVVAQGSRTDGDPFAAAEAMAPGSPGVSVVSDAWGPVGSVLVVLAAEAGASSSNRFYGDPQRARLVPAS
jgi:hypothetical protein